MKIRIRANELQDGEIEFISLVKHGANRSPFKIVKNEAGPPPSLWDGLLPELDKLNQRFADSTDNATTEKTVTKADTRNQIAQREQATLEHTLAGLNDQLFRALEYPTNPLFKRLVDDLSFRIEKCELALASLRDDTGEMNSRSAFFRRGGSSVRSAATLYDSANDDRAAELRKAEDGIDLSPTITTTNEDDVARIDLYGLTL